MPKSETSVIDRLGDEGVIAPVSYDITSYGADFPVDSLVKRIKEGGIFIPEFQRGYVWTYKQASRFIESLLLGLPVPGVFFSKEYDTQKLLVIDGQQRLKSLQFFYEGIFADTGREFVLRGVQEPFEGITYRTLPEYNKRRLDDSIIHATIIHQERPPEDDTSIYYIFERLNTGGTDLSPQEIRSSIYHGPLNLVIKDLNNHPSWRSLYGPINKRMKDQELIVRFFALYYGFEGYKKPMREFINDYMADNRELKLQSYIELLDLFEKTVTVIDEYIGGNAFKPTRALNAAVFDAVMVGVSRRIRKGSISDTESFRQRYHGLLEDKQFQKLTSTSTADEPSVRGRIDLATQAFMDVR